MPAASRAVGQRARKALLGALRRCARGAGLEAVRALAPLVHAAAVEEAERQVDESRALDEALSLELVRVLGGAMAEETPGTAREAALHVVGGRRRRSRRAEPVREAVAEVRALGTWAERITVERLEALERAERLLTEAGPLRELEVEVLQARERLAAALNVLHAPVRIAAEEAVAVARFVLGGDPPVARRGVLALARALDGFCARAPLTKEDREALRVLARAADLERDDPSWSALADRVWTLRARLVTEGRPASPLQRSLAREARRPVTRRPDSVEAILTGREAR